MLINIIGRQLEITSAIQTQAEKVVSPLDIPALKVSSVNVTMTREKNRFTVSLVLNCKYHTLKSEVEDFDLYKALDAAVAKVEAQCRDLKEKKQMHRAVGIGETDVSQSEDA